MKKPIIFFGDGSEASVKAAGVAVELARLHRVNLAAFIIIDPGWNDILGDEWISPSGTRMHFYNWLEGELRKSALRVLQTVEKLALAKGVGVKTEILTGPPEKLIVDCTREINAAYVILPNPHAAVHRAAGGLKFNVGSLAKKLCCPLIIGPK